MVPLARRNLFHDKIRLVLSVIGLAIPVALVLYNLGILAYAMNSAGVYIEQVDADIWVSQAGVETLPERSRISNRVKTAINQITRIQGVTDVTPLLIADIQGEIVTGRAQEPKFALTLVGYDTESGRGGPWRLREGSQTVAGEREIILDGKVADTNGIKVGDTIRIAQNDFQVVALSKDTSTLSEQMGFLPLKRAQQVTSGDQNTISYLLVKTAGLPATRSDSRQGPVWTCPLCDEISRQTELSAFSQAHFKENSINIWLEWIGVWMIAISVIILGVGVVVVMITTYTATIERLPEFGVLKAIGSTNRYIAGVVLQQAFISATFGYLIGLGLTILLAALTTQLGDGTQVVVSPTMGVATYLIVILLSGLAALLAIYKAVRVDPMVVFQARF